MLPEHSGLETLAQAAYKLLGLQSYFTAGPMEVRAWTVRIGAKAPEAAGIIHSDIELLLYTCFLSLQCIHSKLD